MFGVKKMIYSQNFREIVQDVFGGLDRRASARNGAIADMLNMSADRYPALTVRPRRGEYASVKKPNGFCCWDCVAWVDGTKLMIDGEEAATLEDSKKMMVGIQRKLCIWPDKVIYDLETAELTPMEAQWEGEAAFCDGTYAGEPALANTIIASGDLTKLFRAGDGVAVTAGVGGIEGETMGAYVLQEIEYDQTADETELRFLEETWRRFVTESENSGELEEGMRPFPGVGIKIGIRIQRRTPELEGMYEHHNRLWGWIGGTIFCCKLGDPTNWESFNGDATDSWELETGSPGDITGGISYGGRPLFFKENRVIRIYGDYPGQYSTSESESLGVEAGSGKSLAIAGDTLFYKSPAGIMAYTGGYPYCISEELGERHYKNAVAGSDGVSYYVSMERDTGDTELLRYDTRHRVWHTEDGDKSIGMGWHGELYDLEEPGMIYILGNRRSESYGEQGILTKVEFADFDEGTTRKKTPGRLLLRLEIDDGTDLDVFIRYDSRGDWIKVKHFEGKFIKGQVEAVIPLRRCDHYRVRIEGNGLGGSNWTLHAVTRERSVGSNRE